MDCLVVKALMRIHDNYERCGVPWRPSLMTVAREVYKAGFYSELDEWGVDRKLMESFDRECPTNCRCELRVNGKPVTNDDVDSLPWCDIRDMKPLVLAFRHWEGNSGVFRDVIIGVHRDTGELVCTPRLDPDPEWYWRLPFLTVTAKMFPFYGDVVI